MRKSAGEQDIEQDTDGVDIRRRTGGSKSVLLGGGIAVGADQIGIARRRLL